MRRVSSDLPQARPDGGRPRTRLSALWGGERFTVDGGVIIRCRLRRRGDNTRICGGLLGGGPDGAVQIGPVERIEHAAPENMVMLCGSCRRYVEVRLPHPMEGVA